MNIRVLAFAAIAMGVLVLGVTAALPWIVEQSYAAALKHYGAEHLASSAAREDLASRWSGILVTIFLGATAIVAGLCILQRRPIGARLWIGVCAAFIAFSVVDFVRTGLSVPSVVRLVFWGIALLLSVPVLRKQSSAWFSRSE